MEKIFVAYLLPPLEDAHLLLEDGLQWIAKGRTKEEATTNLRKEFERVLREYESHTDEEIEAVWKTESLYVTEV